MASIYQRNNKIYISWYDFKSGKVKSKSLKLEATSANLRKANKIKAEFELSLETEKRKLNSLGIERKTLGSAFKHFLDNNSSKRPKTIKDYHRFFNLFKQSFNPDSLCTNITKLSVEKWINEIKQLKNKKNGKPLKLNTIYGYQKQLNHFLNFLFEYSYTPMFKINKDVKAKRELTEKIIFNKHDLIKIFDGLDEKSSGFRAAVNILYYTGLRPSDILSIKKENINLEERTIKYYSLKRKMHREIPFHSCLLDIFRERISSTDNWIVPYAKSEHLGRALKRYLKLLDLSNKKYTPYTFRKTFFTFARANGIRDEVVRELIGHAQDSVGNIHYNVITIESMFTELELFPTISSIKDELEKKNNLKSSNNS